MQRCLAQLPSTLLRSAVAGLAAKPSIRADTIAACLYMRCLHAPTGTRVPSWQGGVNTSNLVGQHLISYWALSTLAPSNPL